MVEVLVRVVNGEEINPSEMEISNKSMEISIMLMDVSLEQSCELKHNFQNDNLNIIFVTIILSWRCYVKIFK